MTRQQAYENINASTTNEQRLYWQRVYDRLDRRNRARKQICYFRSGTWLGVGSLTLIVWCSVLDVFTHLNLALLIWYGAVGLIASVVMVGRSVILKLRNEKLMHDYDKRT